MEKIRTKYKYLSCIFVLVSVLLLLTSCISSNKLFDMDGDSGTKENLPVHVEVLVEMAEYCENVYDE